MFRIFLQTLQLIGLDFVSEAIAAVGSTLCSLRRACCVCIMHVHVWMEGTVVYYTCMCTCAVPFSLLDGTRVDSGGRRAARTVGKEVYLATIVIHNLYRVLTHTHTRTHTHMHTHTQMPPTQIH